MLHMQQVTLSQAIQLAIQHHQAGRLNEAESIYWQVLAVDPENIDALHLLGIIAHQAGNSHVAVEFISRAIANGANAPEPYINLAQAYRSLGQMDESIAHLRQALKLRPNDPLALMLLAASYADSNRLEEAVPLWHQLIEREPNNAQYHSNLGVTLERLGRLDEALAACTRAIELDQNYAQGHNNLGCILYKLGRHAPSAEAHHKALQLNPNFAEAWKNLTTTLQEMGQLAAAIESARRATELAPDDPAAFRQLALAFDEQGDLDQAAAMYDRAIALLKERTRNLPPDARTSDVDWLNRLRVIRAIMLPPVYSSGQEIETRREQLIQNLADLQSDRIPLHLDQDPEPTLFSLAYQGHDDRAIAEAFASLIEAPQSPAIGKQRSPKIHVAFISRFFRDHTIGRLNMGLIAMLNREHFDVSVFSVGDPQDSVAKFIRDHADSYIALPPLLPAARRIISERSPDILFYTDLGMDPITFSLACSRLAPVQCVTWGHPVTTGLPTVDYFISSEILDPAGNEAHYTENLARLPQLSVYYYKPTLKQPKVRADFGLPEDATLYGCLQMLWKFHPDFDEPIAEILRRDPHGRLLLIHGINPHWDHLLTQRWQRVMPDVADRVIWLPRQSTDDFLALTALCNVMLDPTHFGGGNTTYEALAFGVPVITMPSRFLRGRLTLAMYEMMQMRDCVAETVQQYADLAVTIATDSDRRREVRAKIADGSSALFENVAAVEQLGEFFRSVCHV